MSSKLSQGALAHPLRLVALATLSLALAGCGGGGGDPGTVGTGTGTGTGTDTGGTGTTTEPTVTLSVVNSSDTAVTSLSGTQIGSARAVVKDATGKPAANVIVQFTLSAPLLKLNPESGSALTDANGVAKIDVSPASLTAGGAVSITATAVVAAKTASAISNLSVTASSLTVSSLAFSPAPTGSLPALSSAALNVGVSAGGQPATEATGLTLTSLCVNDGAATLTLGAFANGVQAATYVNKGCSRGTDVITASIGGSTMNTSIAVDAASIGTIQFVGSSADGTAIVLKGSGGQGRSESALLTYRVTDERNVGLQGVTVTFAPSTSTGGLSVQPSSGVTDANGNVTTTVASGTIPTPVRVLAQATRSGRTVTGLSDTLIISTGLPIQKAFSLSVDKYNIRGWDIDGVEAQLTARLADQYGNPIADGTAVSFVAEGGAVGSPGLGGCVTAGGSCSVPLKSQNFRPANGRVTVLAYIQGIENFVDMNGDGQYSCTTFAAPDGTVPLVYRPLIDTCISGGEPFTDMGDPFLDAGHLGSTLMLPYGSNSFDFSYDPAKGDLPFPYNRSVYSGTGNGKWGLNYIRASAEITFSGSVPYVWRQVCTDTECEDFKPIGSAEQYTIKRDPADACTKPLELFFRLTDLHNNPLPVETTVTTTNPVKVALGKLLPDEVPSTSAVGGTIHKVVITPADCTTGTFNVSVTVPEAGSSKAVTYPIAFTVQ